MAIWRFPIKGLSDRGEGLRLVLISDPVIAKHLLADALLGGVARPRCRSVPIQLRGQRWKYNNGIHKSCFP